MFIWIAVIAFAVLAGLKVSNQEPVSKWSWWWITAPLWIYAIFLAIFLGLMAMFGFAIMHSM